jgi:hypothetical protein
MKINYPLVRERAYLAIAFIKLAEEILKLLNVTFNYSVNDCLQDAYEAEMVIKI